MKKLIALLILVTACFYFVGCSDNSVGAGSRPSTTIETPDVFGACTCHAVKHMFNIPIIDTTKVYVQYLQAWIVIFDSTTQYKCAADTIVYGQKARPVWRAY